LQRAGNGGSPVRQADALPVPDLIATEIVENLEAASMNSVATRRNAGQETPF
jgi:hypothetical protein